MKLTPREKEIAMLVTMGFLNINIAARLGLSEWTVKNHLKRIYLKLGIHAGNKRAHLAQVNIHS